MTPRLRATGTWMLSLAVGLAAAVVIHFMLYRMGLPLRPFIYVVF